LDATTERQALCAVQGQIEGMMDFVLRARTAHFEPNADVFADNDGGEVIVKVEVAGANPESLQVTLDERSLVIRGLRRPADGRSRRGSFLQKEIADGEFLKRVYLPLAVQYENVRATYCDGILVITLPISATHYHQTSRTEIRMTIKRTLD
jgi:HSP20 family protein